MFVTLADDVSHVVVGKGIDICFAFPAAFHKFCVFKDPELMGDGGLFHLQKLCNRADAKLAFKQGVQDLYPCGVPEDLEKISQIAEKTVVRQIAFHRFKGVAVVVGQGPFSSLSYEYLFI